jgi:hypothetical protein
MDGVAARQRKDDLMAKRKAARAKGKPAPARASAVKKATARRSGAGQARAKARKAAAERGSGRRKAVKRTAKTAAKAGRQRTGAVARKAAVGRTAAKGPARKAVKKAAKRAAPPARKRAAPPRAAATKNAAVPVRKAPALNRERRVIQDDDIVQSTPPSSLDLNRTASSARSGRKSLRDRYDEHTETSPALTGGDVDADWESAYSVGDEAPGGDNPTPDQDIVDDIGRAVGVEYQDNEELKGADKVAKRDKNRWELDPASSDDWDDR